MGEQDYTPAATEDFLDLTVAQSPDRKTALEVYYREILASGELGDVVKVERVIFAVRGNLPIPMMTSLLRTEESINAALADVESQDEEHLSAAMRNAHDRIIGILFERNPAALRPRDVEVEDRGTVRVKPSIELDPAQVLLFLSWVSGDLSIADLMARVLTAGRSGAIDADDSAAEDTAAEGADPVPFASP